MGTQIATRNLPYMDGTHECITGLLFRSTFFLRIFNAVPAFAQRFPW